MDMDIWGIATTGIHPHVLPFDGADGTRYIIKRAEVVYDVAPGTNSVLPAAIAEGSEARLENEAAVLQKLAPLAGSVVPVLYATPWLNVGGLQVLPQPLPCHPCQCQLCPARW